MCERWVSSLLGVILGAVSHDGFAFCELQRFEREFVDSSGPELQRSSFQLFSVRGGKQGVLA